MRDELWTAALVLALAGCDPNQNPATVATRLGETPPERSCDDACTEPTTGAAPPLDPGSSTSGTTSDPATATLGGIGYDDGCDCQTTPTTSLWLLGFAPLLRRRRRPRLDTRPVRQ